MNLQHFLFLGLAVIAFVHETTAATDKTLEDGAIGEDAVDATIDKISRSGVFQKDDYSFVKRVAYVESLYGVTGDTSSLGGLWKVNERRYDLTKAANLTSYHQNITAVFQINWNQTNKNDLRKPLYSGLAMRLFFTHIEAFEAIPQTLKLQAAYWNKHYNNIDGLNDTHFIEEITELENSTRCNGKMDLLVVLDESGSIGAEAYKKALGFVGNLFGSYSLETVRQGFLTFSADVRQIFPIDNNLTATQIQETVNNTEYKTGGTETSKALRAAAELYNKTSVRSGVPRVMTLFTDGGSSDKLGVGNAALLKAIDVVSYAIGIGANNNETELKEIAYGDETRVFILDGFESLQDFFGRLNKETCSVPQKPELNETTTDSLSKNEKRIYTFEVPVEGLTLFLNTSVGQTSGFYSYSYPKPSAALNDGVLNAVETFIPSPTASKEESRNSIILKRIFSRAGETDATTVFVTIQGKDDKNNYTVQATPGDQTTGSAGIQVSSAMLCLLAYAFTVFGKYVM